MKMQTANCCWGVVTNLELITFTINSVQSEGDSFNIWYWRQVGWGNLSVELWKEYRSWHLLKKNIFFFFMKIQTYDWMVLDGSESETLVAFAAVKFWIEMKSKNRRQFISWKVVKLLLDSAPHWSASMSFHILLPRLYLFRSFLISLQNMFPQ